MMMNELFVGFRKMIEFAKNEFSNITNILNDNGLYLMAIQDQVAQLQQAIAALDAQAVAQGQAVQSAINALNESVAALTSAAVPANLSTELAGLIAQVQQATTDVDKIYSASVPAVTPVQAPEVQVPAVQVVQTTETPASPAPATPDVVVPSAS
jgi:hypothetical protein